MLVINICMYFEDLFA